MVLPRVRGGIEMAMKDHSCRQCRHYTSTAYAVGEGMTEMMEGDDGFRYVPVVYKVDGDDAVMDVRVFSSMSDAKFWPMMSDIDGDAVVLRCCVEMCDSGKDELYLALIYKVRDGILVVDPQLYGDEERAERFCNGRREGTKARIFRCKVDEWEE